MREEFHRGCCHRALRGAKLFIMNDNFLGLPVALQIRELRRIRGLTLEEVATAAGTSAPTLHRYESGWSRFEIRTLERIARALGAGLEVRLIPARLHAVETPGPEELIRKIAPLFWDVDLQPGHLARYPEWVLGRVLQFGGLEQVRPARAFFGDEAIARAVGRRGVDERTRAFWETVLEQPCTPRS